MSPVSFAAGSRFLSLIGGHTTTFYDWYADLPPASPQVFGDQTDVPESADWWDASYLIVWGTNLPITRTPDAHFMTEARYRGQKVVVVSPGLLRPREVRRRLAARPAGHRRRAGDGDGPRDAQGVLGRPAGARASRTTASASPTCRCSSRSSERDGVHVPGSLPDGRRPRRGRASTPTGSRSLLDAVDRRAGGAERLGRLPLRRGGQGPLEPAARRRSTRCSRCTAVTSEAVEVALPRFDVGDGPGGARDAPRRAGDPRRRAARDHGARPDARDLRRRARRAAGRLAGGLRRRDAALHARRGRRRSPSRRPPAGGQGRARVRAQRGGQRRALDDLHGRGHQPLVPLRRDLPLVHRAAAARAAASASTAAAGRTTSARRRSARSRAGRRSRSRWTGGARRARRRARRGSTRTPSSGATTGCARSGSPRRSGAGLFDGQTAIDAHAKAVRMGWMPSLPDVRPQPAGPRRRGRRGRRRPGRARRRRAEGRPAELRGRRPERAVELPARVLRVALEPARLLGQGPGVLPAPPARRRPRRSAGRAAAAGASARRACAGARRSRAASSTCWSTSTSG